VKNFADGYNLEIVSYYGEGDVLGWGDKPENNLAGLKKFIVLFYNDGKII
jgi:hypothetical protein